MRSPRFFSPGPWGLGVALASLFSGVVAIERDHPLHAVLWLGLAAFLALWLAWIRRPGG